MTKPSVPRSQLSGRKPNIPKTDSGANGAAKGGAGKRNKYTRGLEVVKSEQEKRGWSRVPRRFEPAYKDYAAGLSETESRSKQAKLAQEAQQRKARSDERRKEQVKEKIRPRTLEELCRQSVIDPAHNQKRKWRYLKAAELSKFIGRKVEVGGWVHPIFEAQGNLTGDAYVRFDDYVTEGLLRGAERKRKKYFQQGVGSLVYWDPTVKWMDPSIHIVAFEEGVKKGASTNDSDLRTKYGVHGIAFGGAYSWHLEGDWTLHHEVADYLVNHPNVTTALIILDSDVKPSTLHAVRKQEFRLAQAIFAAVKREITVKIVHLPSDCGKIDDYLREHGPDNAWDRIKEAEVIHRCTIEAFNGHLGTVHRGFVYDLETHSAANIPTAQNRVVQRMSKEEFMDDHATKKVKWMVETPSGEWKEKEMPAGKIWWSSSSLRIDVTRVVKKPMSWDEWQQSDHNPLLDDGTLNSFWPADLEPIEGDTSRFDKLLECITNNSRHRVQLEQVMAYKIRHPADPMGYAEFVYSLLLQGIGKTTYGSWFIRLLGAHNCAEITTDLLIKDIYNGWLEHMLLIVLNEGLEPPSQKEARSLAATLQQFIGVEGNVVIRPIYGAKREAESHGFWLLFTNSELIMGDMPDKARRFDMVHGRDDKRLLTSDEFCEQVLGMKKNPVTGHWEEDPEEDRRFFDALLYRLLRVTDLTGFNPRLPREDDDRKEYTKSGRSPWKKWMRDLRDGVETWPDGDLDARHVGDAVNYVTVDLMVEGICTKFKRSIDQPRWGEVAREMPRAGWESLGQLKAPRSEGARDAFSLWARNMEQYAQDIQGAKNAHEKIIKLFQTEFPGTKPRKLRKYEKGGE